MTNKVRQRPKKRTKIVATIGPASENEATLRGMIQAGLDVVRINFSHSSHQQATALTERVRQLAAELNTPVAILGDLRGPRIRVGEIKGGTVELENNQELWLTPQPVQGDNRRVSVSYHKLAENVEIGSPILLDDGNIRLKVERIEADGSVLGRVVQGGSLSSRRGVNLPQSRVNLPAVTDKDYTDIDFAIAHDFDFLALSFVQSVDDVRHLNQYLADKGADIPVIAKIERKSALEDIQAIVQAAYGVMVARGDLALEMSIPQVPIVQKQIIAACRQAAVPVITATQMLETMITNCKPTRAEATDVANAIIDGTDAVMLSGETAIGEHPLEVITTMSAIAQAAERAWLHDDKLPGPPSLAASQGIGSTIAYASYVIANRMAARAIVVYTASGATARQVVSHRPTLPVLALSTYERTRRRLALSWGVESALSDPVDDTDRMATIGWQQAQETGLAQAGERVIIVAGNPPSLSGQTNTIRVESVPQQPGPKEGQSD